MFAERLRVDGTRDGMWINRNCQSIRSYTHNYCSPHLTSSTISVVALYIHLSSSTSGGVWLARAVGYMFSTGTECVGTGLDMVEEFVSMWDIEIRSRMSSGIVSIDK